MKKTFTLIALLIIVNYLFADDYEKYTYKLTQSTSSIEIWTTTPAHKVRKYDDMPTETGDKIKVYCAKNEFEPFQIIIKSNSNTNLTISMGNFGSGITTEINKVGYINLTEATDALGATGDFPDPLIPVENPTSSTFTANQNSAFWVTVYVPTSVTGAANYTANLTVGNITIPVELHVFDFSISETPHIKSQMNFSHNIVLQKYGVTGTGSEYWEYIDKMKQYFIDHRLTPKSVLWSGGLTSSGATPYIDYDCNNNLLTDNDGIWGFETPAERYLDGTGLMNGEYSELFNNGYGFPSFMAATMKNNDPSQEQRPEEFCGIQRNGIWQNSSEAYNQKWFQYITEIQDYLTSKNYIDRAYYYFANEPQDQADYDAIAWYSERLKEAAPNLKLMISEEPKPEIFNHPNYNAKIDIWLPVLNNYAPVVSWQRANLNEETWIYFLHGTRPPYFNPITIDHQGIEAKFTGWFLWKYRIRGCAYYAMNNWNANPWTSPMDYGQNGNKFLLYPPSQTNENIPYGANNHRFVPSIRFELIRDGFEDYEYLYILAGNQQPQENTTNIADNQADKIISGLTSYTRDAEFMYNLRRLIGLKNGGEISEIPDITPQSGHWRSQGSPQNYYINFQDPTGTPTTSYTQNIFGDDYSFFNFDNKEYLQIGDNNYDENLGYGWFAPDDVNWKLTYDQWFENGNELQKSQIYSDWGRKATFEFDLPNGNYEVTVGIGHRGTHPNQFITVEGVSFYENASTTNNCLTKKLPISIHDKKLTVEMGNGNDYTMLNFIDIEAKNVELNEKTENFVQVYPNPFTDEITFNIKNSADLYIYDLNGKIIFSEKITSNTSTKDLSFLTKGVYTYKIVFQQKVVNGKIIKK